MDCTQDLPSVIAKLVAIDHAGWLTDLEHELAAACRGPREPLDRYPHHRLSVERYARVASELLGLPYADCRAAAVEVILPTTRLRIALELIEEYTERLEAEPVRDFARATLQRERRRRA